MPSDITRHTKVNDPSIPLAFCQNYPLSCTAFNEIPSHY